MGKKKDEPVKHIYKQQRRLKKEAEWQSRLLAAADERSKWIYEHYGVYQFYNPDKPHYRIKRRKVHTYATKKHPAAPARHFVFGKDQMVSKEQADFWLKYGSEQIRK